LSGKLRIFSQWISAPTEFSIQPQIINTSSEAHKGTALLFKLSNNTNAHLEDKIA